MEETPASRPLFSRSVAFLALLGYSVLLILPMVWVGYSSLKGDDAIFRDAFALPSAGDLRTDNYARAWHEAHFGEYFLNSVVVTGASVALIVALGAMAAYALARFTHSVGRVVFALFLAGLTLPAQLAIVPLFFELRAAAPEAPRRSIRSFEENGVVSLCSCRIRVVHGSFSATVTHGKKRGA